MMSPVLKHSMFLVRAFLHYYAITQLVELNKLQFTITSFIAIDFGAIYHTA